MKHNRILAAALVSLALPFAGAHAAQAAGVFDQVQPAKNRIDFVFKQMNVPVNGYFKKAKVDLAFDPAAPAKSTVRLDLDLASIDAGSSDANTEVVGKPWFDVKAFPTATFVSSSVKPLGGDRYEMTGKLTIKGKTRDVTTPVTVKQNGNTATFDGAFTLKRLEFAIGDGTWSDTSIVADEVKVSFHVEAVKQ
ncbi:polyisoprenoid-binding protein [Aromatoleum toluvorans]|uniref:Polyisoprenoid-binding protein n=1 Tax=Aromatoleum toluvorans TaxID=92002 RepID=A0ABX1Q0B8_9RHOO|nr:YceI family protein [Aromatoleum toluvorans]NMG44392.1 polyisoprenoid-binding protein [Aromatoleum toluvorans]